MGTGGECCLGLEPRSVLGGWEGFPRLLEHPLIRAGCCLAL